MSNADAFANARKRRAAERQVEQDRKNGNYGGNFEETPYTPLITNGWKAFRLLGLPVGTEGRTPTDPKLIESSMILADNEKKFRVTWDTNENWILRRIYNLVLAGKWNSTTNSKDYDYANRCPTIFQRVYKNSNPQNQYENGWRPTKFVVQNVIDLSMLDSHSETGMAKILSKKEPKPKPGQERLFYERGYAPTLYNMIWDNIVEFMDDWEGYNVAVKKLTDDPWYKAYPANSSDLKMFLTQEDPTLLALLEDQQVNDRVSEMVKSLKRVDIDKITQVTSYTKIMNKLGGFIKQVDEYFGRNFYVELESEVAREKALWDSQKAQQADANGTVADPTMAGHQHVTPPPAAPVAQGTVAQPAPAPVQTYSAPATPPPAQPVAPQGGAPAAQAAPAPTTPVAQTPPMERPAPAAPAPVQSAEYPGLSPEYKGMHLLSLEEKAVIRGVTPTGDLDFFEADAAGNPVTLMRCSCQGVSPASYSVCPKCGITFQQAA